MSEWQLIEDQDTWNSSLKDFGGMSLQQSWQWGEVNAALGHRVIRFLLINDDTPAAGMQVIVKSAKRGRYLEVPGGPLLDWQDEALVSLTLEKLREVARAEHCVFVRFRPQLSDDEHWRKLLAQYGAKPALMHISADHTSIVTLEPSTEQLLTNMRRQTRYEVRRSTKRGVVVDEPDDPTLLDTFHQLQADTAKRQGFIAPSKQYLEACVAAFSDDAHIYTASKDGQLLNVALVLCFGEEAAYFEAASTPRARQEPGAYSVVWAAMQAAKSAGLSQFNLWGTAPADAPNHRYAGVTTFKRGFGGDDVAYVSAHDLVIQPLPYMLTRLFEWGRKKRRKL